MQSRDDLRLALDCGQIEPHFQPQINLRTGELSGFEVLARWRHPDLGLIPPTTFIPLAEAAGLIGSMTTNLLERAFRTAQQEVVPIPLSINVSPLQLRDRSLPRQIQQIAEQTGFDLHDLTVELTETALLEDLEQARIITDDLKCLGIKLALDDFGTGYSSLTHLQALAFDELKVDQSFIRSIINRRASRKIVAAVVGLGRSLGLKTVAEGVEEQAQADMLLSLGCELGQGWLYGRPVPVEELSAVVDAYKHPGWTARRESEAEQADLCIEAMPMQRYAQLQAIYDGAQVGLCFLDCEFRYVNLNRRLAAMNGTSIHRHLGRSVKEILPAFYEAVEPFLRRALEGESITDVEAEKPNAAVPEEPLTTLSSYQPARDELGEIVGILVSVVDISERKKWERTLRESEDHYRHMVELNPQIPWTMSPNGLGIEIGPRWESITGVSLSDAQRLGWLSAVHPDDVQGVMAVCLDALRKGDNVDFECRVGRGDGKWHWIRSRGAPRRNAQGRIERWYGGAEVIDEQKTAAQALLASQARLQSIIDATPVGIVIAEAPTGRVVSRNPAAEKILHQDPSEFEKIEDYATRVAYYCDGQRLEADDFPLARALRYGETTESQQVFYDLGGGTGKWLTLRGAPFRDDSGAIIGAVAVIQEVERSCQQTLLGARHFSVVEDRGPCVS